MDIKQSEKLPPIKFLFLNHKREFFEIRKTYRYHTVQYHVSLLSYECYDIIMYEQNETISPLGQNIFCYFNEYSLSYM